MLDRRDIKDAINDTVEKITHRVSGRRRHHGMMVGVLGAALLLALAAILLLVRRRGSKGGLLGEGEPWDGESLPETFPDRMQSGRADDLGEGDDAAVPESRARRARRPANGSLASAEGDITPQPA
jgi:hypothetical protein